MTITRGPFGLWHEQSDTIHTGRLLGTLRDGATLVARAADVIDIISTMHGAPLREPGRVEFQNDAIGSVDEDTVTAARRDIVERLGPTPVSVNALVRDTGYPPAAVWTILLELELAGRLERLPGAMVALICLTIDAELNFD